MATRARRRAEVSQAVHYANGAVEMQMSFEGMVMELSSSIQSS